MRVLLTCALVLAACVGQGPAGNGSEVANPASVFCEERGGTVEIRTGEDGSQQGVCVFADGSECDEWAFYRGECQPGTADETVVPVHAARRDCSHSSTRACGSSPTSAPPSYAIDGSTDAFYEWPQMETPAS
jgi:putative hemolysin